ncbi:hypothetical protein KUTeg_012734 [Tegillarca granosa]|uniref:Pre-rRNA-processing protein RIX1 N-terminal domain-containing protein n=1 Tax=Tegillarca granosa TaxID=220873 RepID=A0ABQ9F0C9_TEGGR|nr:hypothetical protein KUTeg_012734 [Tegillarca granosa]
MSAPMDSVVLHLASNICDKTNGLDETLHLLHVLDQLQVFGQQKTGNIQDIISHIHSCLNSSKQRLEGLLLLERLVEQCVTDVFTQNALVWLRFILQILQSHDPVIIQKLSCHVCCRILDQASTFTVLSRDISSLVPQLLPVLMSSSTQWREAALTCIISCIDNFPGPCGTFKGKIENFVVQELDKGLVFKQEAVRCFAVVARCGGSGNLGIKHTEGWSNQCNKLLGSLQMTITDLYEGLHLSDSASQIRHTLSLSLSSTFTVTVKVPVADIIDIVSQALSVNSKILKSKTTTERLSLFTQLPTIHKSAVLIISALINSCKNLLLPYTKQIINMLVQELIWTRTPVQYGQCRLYSALRICVYESLTTWFQNVGVLVETTSEEEDLINAILHDVKHHTDTVKVDKQGQTFNEGTDAPPVKKKKKGGYQEISHGISTQRKIDNNADYMLTVAALNTLYWMLTLVGETMQLRSIKVIQDFVISTSMLINQQRGNTVIPYHHGDCRHGLYKVLQACVLVPHSEAPCPLRCVLSIYRMGILDRDNHVSSFCKECLRICEVLIHPRAPCFKAPVICNETVSVNGINSQQSDLYQSNETEAHTALTTPSAVIRNTDNSRSKDFAITSFKASGINISENLSNQKNLGIQGHENIENSEEQLGTVDGIRHGNNDNRLSLNVSQTDTDYPMTSSSSMVLDTADRNSLGNQNRNDEPENVVIGTISGSSMTTNMREIDNEMMEVDVHNDTNIKDGDQESGRNFKQQEEDPKVTMDTVDPQHKSDDEELDAMLSSFKDTDPDI